MACSIKDFMIDGTLDSSFTLTDMNQPRLRIIEEPKQYGFRFRYECEGKSHGGIPGISNEKGKRTFPSIEILNYKGLARIVVSLVTNEEMPRPHAHSLVGKHCANGICSVQVGPSDMTASFANLGILHITKRNVIPTLIKRMREYNETSQTLWGQSNGELTDNMAEQRAKDLAKDMDLASVRLCFQAFLPADHNQFSRPLPPVVSVPIFDSKAPNAATLKICRMDRSSGSAEGGDEVYMLCDKVQKDDIQVRFFETSADENTPSWEAFADFGPTDVHRQYAIVFKTPRYKNGDISKPVHVHLQLMRRSTYEKSEPKPFCYYPMPFDKEEIIKKRKKPLHHFSTYSGYGGVGGGGTTGGGSGGMGSGNFGSPQHLCFSNNSMTMNHENQLQQLSTINGTAIQGSNLFLPRPQQTFPHNILTMPTAQMQPNAMIPQNLSPIDILQFEHDSAADVDLSDLLASVTTTEEPENNGVNLVSRGLGTAKSTGSKLISRGLGKSKGSDKRHSTGMDTSESGDSDVETDSAPDPEIINNLEHKHTPTILAPVVTSYPSKTTQIHCAVQTDATYLGFDDHALKLAENTSRALYDYSITGDVKMMLAVQRHLTAIQDDFGDTCLHMSIIHQEYEVTRSLLAIIVSIPRQNTVNLPNNLRQTPLHLAVLTQRPKTVELLMSYGADPNLMDQRGNTPFHWAIQNRDVDSAYAILHGSKQSAVMPRIRLHIDMLNTEGYASIHLACRNGDLKCLKAIYHAHCNVNIQDGHSGYSALHISVENQNFGILGFLLLDTNADVHAVAFNGNTPLHLASGRNLVAVAALLMASGADPLKENFDTYKDQSDDGEDEHERVVVMDTKDDEPCGKTSVDFANTEMMRRILNGEPYVKSSFSSGTADPCRSDALVSDRYDSFKINSNMVTLCNPITLDKLARLLDLNEAWVGLAYNVGLGNIISRLRQADSPTRDLLYHFEKIDGTMKELTNVLTTMEQSEAVDIISDGSTSFSTLLMKPLMKGSYLDSIKDSGISEMMESFRRSMAVDDRK